MNIIQIIMAFSGSAPAGGEFLLDNINYTGVAYSLGYLKTGGVTNVIKVRRDSDDATLDVTPTDITDGTLETFVGAGNGYVDTYYDQNGTGNDLITTGLTKQPMIVDTGVLILRNGKPAMKFNGTTNSFNLTSTIVVPQVATPGYFMAQVMERPTVPFASRATWGNALTDYTRTINNQFVHQPSSVATINNVEAVSNRPYFKVTYCTAVPAIRASQNGVDRGSHGTPTSDSDIRFFGQTNGIWYFDGWIQDLFLFTEDASLDISTINAHINKNFNIFNSDITLNLEPDLTIGYTESSSTISLGGITGPRGLSNDLYGVDFLAGGSFYHTAEITVEPGATYRYTHIHKDDPVTPYNSLGIAIRDQTNAVWIDVDVPVANAAEWTYLTHDFTVPIGCTSIRVYPQRLAGVVTGKHYYYKPELIKVL